MLPDRFDIKPNEQARTTINRIHQTLRQAWEAGDIVAFIAADGTELCEKEFCVNGSAAVSHPQVFGLPGTDSPEAGYVAMSYEDFLHQKAQGSGHRNGHHTPQNGHGPAVPDDGEPQAGADAPVDREVAEPAAPEEEIDPAQAVAEAVAESKGYEVPGPAPEWLPDRLLTHIVSLPKAVACWRAGLDRAQGAEKLQLIRAGIRRKGGFDELSAQKMTTMCRGDGIWWDRAFWAAVDQYKEWGEWIEPDDFPALRDDPAGFLIENEGRYHPEAILLCGITLDGDPEALLFVASEAEAALEDEEDQQTVSIQEELRRQVSTLEAEAAELRKQLDEQEDEAKAQEQRADDLSAELTRLREAESAASSKGKQLADAEQRGQKLIEENAALRSRLERGEARAAEVEQLRHQIAEHERKHDELAVRASAVENERRLREQAEARLQDQIAETRRLERELGENGIKVAPEDGGGALIRALAKPIGEAAEHAARRLAAGRSLPDDARLLEFAGAFGQLATSVSPASDDESPGIAPTEPAADRVPEPEDRAEAGTDEITAPSEGAELADAASVPQTGDGQEAVRAPDRRRRARTTPAFTVHPFGGASEVGGSALVVQSQSGDTVLLDAGQRVKGEYGLDTQSPFHYSLPPFDQLDAIAISHAHIDHIGSLPLLYREYQRHREEPLPVLMSEPTKRVGEIMMRDSAKIQHKRLYLTGGAFSELAQSDFAPELDLKPAYDEADINDVLDAVEICEPRLPRVIPGTNLSLKLLPVAHVLGSCAVHLTDRNTGKTLLYTGDLGPLTDPQKTLPDFDGVNGFEPADVVIMESTYALASQNEKAGRRDPTREDALNALYRAANRARRLADMCCCLRSRSDALRSCCA